MPIKSAIIAPATAAAAFSVAAAAAAAAASVVAAAGGEHLESTIRRHLRWEKATPTVSMDDSCCALTPHCMRSDVPSPHTHSFPLRNQVFSGSLSVIVELN